MQAEPCSEAFSLLLTPTIKRTAQDIAAARGISVGSLIRSLIAQEGAMRHAGESPATDDKRRESADER